jgi:RNA 2',3'-cyclic 3'-phosphodiesterase
MKLSAHDTEAPSPGTGPARVFIALWPPPAVAAALHARGLRACADGRARREAPHRLHLTLHFLGAVPRERLPLLQAALCLSFSPFELRFGTCTRWPSGVVVAEPLSVPPGLLALHAALARALAAMGQVAEAPGFRPHVTLARGHAGSGLATHPPEKPMRWRVSRYAVAESLPGPPAPYRMLKTCSAQTAAGSGMPPGHDGEEARGDRHGNSRRA